MVMEVTARLNILQNTIYKRKKRLPLSAHDRGKSLYQAVSVSLPTGNSARTAYLHCIKLGANMDSPYNNGKEFRLAPSGKLGSMNFTIEMETGTGKTYVYLRTIFELNRQYGFTKFIIVVPSVAIKEGVRKSIEMTADHFKSLYDNVRFDSFVYDSQNLGLVRSFATSDYIQIMVINIDAFRRSFTDPEREDKANIIHRIMTRWRVLDPLNLFRQQIP